MKAVGAWAAFLPGGPLYSRTPPDDPRYGARVVFWRLALGCPAERLVVLGRQFTASIVWWSRS